MAHTSLKRFLLGVWEVAEVVLISLATVLFIRFFLFQPFLVSGASMEPNFSDREYLIVDEASLYFQNLARGDVVVFRYPRDPSTYFIKRIVALPGERIVNENGTITIFRKGQEHLVLQEPYLPTSTRTPGKFDVQLGQDEYFVLGDNRSHSFDSGSWGPVKRELIVGLVRLKIFPFDTFGIVGRPAY